MADYCGYCGERCTAEGEWAVIDWGLRVCQKDSCVKKYKEEMKKTTTEKLLFDFLEEMDLLEEFHDWEKAKKEDVE